MTRIKICGITNLEDAREAINYGADALGFIFYPASPRYLSPGEAKKIISRLPPLITKVGVFVNEKQERIRKITRECGLDLIQLNGDESPLFCKRLNYPLIKAIRLKDKASLDLLLKYKVKGCLLDTFVPGRFGGTGEIGNWSLAREAKKFGPVILAGGLNPRNIARAIRKVKPYAVDVASGVEKSPGRKDKKKLREFIQRVRSEG